MRQQKHEPAFLIQIHSLGQRPNEGDFIGPGYVVNPCLHIDHPGELYPVVRLCFTVGA